MDGTLQSIKKQTTTLAVIEALQNYIKVNSLKPGDKLPSEHHLCESLNVSRIAVRESLQHFKSLGIIDSKPKKGAFIKRLMPDNPYKYYIPYMDNHNSVLKELAQMRTIMDIGLIIELLSLIKPEHIEKLKEINNKIEKSDEKSRSALDAEFHSYMIEITGNKMLMGLKPLLIDFFRESRLKRILKNHNTPSAKAYLEHKAIIDALQEKDEMKLFAAIKEHSRNYKEFSNE
jgi:GntR family transcriptional repressor for pyruvate dehydrogenase complex